MEKKKPLGEWVGYHVDPDWDRPTVCWPPCSDCLAGMERFEDEQEAEKALAALRAALF